MGDCCTLRSTHEMDGSTWSDDLRAYSLGDAERRVAAIRDSLAWPVRLMQRLRAECLGPPMPSFPPSHPPPGLTRQPAQQRQRHDVDAQRAALQEIMLFGEWDVASRLSVHPARSCHYRAARRALLRDACHQR